MKLSSECERCHGASAADDAWPLVGLNGRWLCSVCFDDELAAIGTALRLGLLVNPPDGFALTLTVSIARCVDVVEVSE